VALGLSFFTLRVDTVRTGRGVVFDEYPIIETRDWVCVVCLDLAGEAIMVRQYRHGCQAATLEFVAGGIDPAEPPLAAAQRELLEETGYAATHWESLADLSPDTTRHRNRVHLFLATGARRIADQALEPGEEVEVCRRQLSDPGLRGELLHAVHLLALILARESLTAAALSTER
jgi:8-oxo-dGTP pyrophosphatase MutT (NUDIX family)